MSAEEQRILDYKNAIIENTDRLIDLFIQIITTATTKVDRIHQHLGKVEMLAPNPRTDINQLELFLQTVGSNRLDGVPTNLSHRSLWHLPPNNQVWQTWYDNGFKGVKGALTAARFATFQDALERKFNTMTHTQETAHAEYISQFKALKTELYTMIGIDLNKYLSGPTILGPPLPPYQEHNDVNIMQTDGNSVAYTIDIDHIFVNKAKASRDHNDMNRVDMHLRTGIVLTTEHTRQLIISMSASFTIAFREKLFDWLLNADTEAINACNLARDHFIRRPQTQHERDSISEALGIRYGKYGSDIERVKLIYQLRIIAVSAFFVYQRMCGWLKACQ